MSPPIGKLRKNQKRREQERASLLKSYRVRRATAEQRARERYFEQKHETRIDLGLYAGTYGGTVSEPLRPPTMWQRLKNWYANNLAPSAFYPC